jgi:hypothetical protein
MVVKKALFGAKISALSCYDLKSGELLMTLRLRVHVPQMQQVGRHSYLDSENKPLVSIVLKESEKPFTSEMKLSFEKAKSMVVRENHMNTLAEI